VLTIQFSKQLADIAAEEFTADKEFSAETSKLNNARKIAKLQLEAAQKLQDERNDMRYEEITQEFVNRRAAAKRTHEMAITELDIAKTEYDTALFAKYGVSYKEELFKLK
jgi:hypothetical protein